MKKQILASVILATLTTSAFALPLTTPTVDSATISIAADGADHVGVNRVAEDGFDRTSINRIAEDGFDRTGA
ncbi:MAG: phage infection protein, partial [Pseudomonas marincola]